MTNKFLKLSIIQDEIETLKNIYKNDELNFYDFIQKGKYELARQVARDLNEVHRRILELRIKEGKALEKL